MGELLSFIFSAVVLVIIYLVRKYKFEDFSQTENRRVPAPPKKRKNTTLLAVQVPVDFSGNFSSIEVRFDAGGHQKLTHDNVFDLHTTVFCENKIFARGILTADVRKNLIGLKSSAEKAVILLKDENLTLEVSYIHRPGADREDTVKRMKEIMDHIPKTFSRSENLLAVILDDPYPKVRFAALKSAFTGFNGIYTFAPYKEQLLAHEDNSIRILSNLFYTESEDSSPLIEEAVKTDQGLLEVFLGISKKIKNYPPLSMALDIYYKSGATPIQLQVLGLLPLIGDSGATPFLIEQLSDDYLAESKKTAVISALGACGTVEAVPLLRETALEARNAYFKGICLQAIDAIQSRVGTAKEGMLSMAETSGGKGNLSIEE